MIVDYIHFSFVVLFLKRLIVALLFKLTLESNLQCFIKNVINNIKPIKNL